MNWKHLFFFLLILSGCQADAEHASIRNQPSSQPCAPLIQGVQDQEITLTLEPGVHTMARIWAPLESQAKAAGVVFVTGVDGGWLEPADGIYAAVANQLAGEGVYSIFVQYRSPGDLDDSVQDALAGVQWLRERGVSKVAVLAWSFGGAVMVNAAIQAQEITTVIGFSPQARDTEAVGSFSRSQSLLIFHSKEDENVPYEASDDIMNEAPTDIRKERVTFEKGDHQLTGLKDQILPKTLDWLRSELKLQSSSRPTRRCS